MRRILIILACCLLLTTAAFAAGRTDDIMSTTVVYPDGTADVVLTVKVTLDEYQPGLTFPLPKGAEEVQLNGISLEPQPSRDNAAVVLVDITGVCTGPGTYSLNFRYCLDELARWDDTTQEENRMLLLEIPLLSGFEYPVDRMEFTVTFPEGVEGAPNFYSGYFLQSIESDLDYTMKDGVLRGTVTTPMKDRETLLLTMQTAPEGFPELEITEEDDFTHLIYMAWVAGAVLVFWLIFLPCLPVFPLRSTSAPPGIHAGEVASRVNMEGADLTVMVFQWAQLGYIRIAPDRRGERVWLHKRMEMGNERSAFEVRTFRRLFGRNQMVEGTGSRFARLWHQVAGSMDRPRQVTQGGLWARTVCRGLALPVSALAGASMGQNLFPAGGYWQMGLMMVMALLGCLTGWQIQSGAACLHRRRRDELPLAVVCILVWLAAGLFLDRPWAALMSVGVQFLTGILCAWGGRRARYGWTTACQLLGLRRYLTAAKPQQIQDALDQNPDYFFEMAPFALAFGVEDAFARRFGKAIMPQCGYLDAPRSEKRTAREWASLMRHTAETLDRGARRIGQYRD